MDLPDGSSVRALWRREVDHVLDTFARLSPDPDWPVWKVQRDHGGAPLFAIVFGPKRHTSFDSDGRVALVDPEEADASGLVEATESGLGGTYVDPPAMKGRIVPVNGLRLWSMAAIRREVGYALAKATNADALRAAAAWDDGQALPFPALRRYIVKSPAMANVLRACFRARPGTRYVMGEVDELHRGRMPTPVALDPGGDLADWQETLSFVDIATGTPLRATTDPLDSGVVLCKPAVVLLATLDAKGALWAERSPSEDVVAVIVDPLRVRRVGRVSGVLDAYDNGERGNLLDYRAAYRRCACGCGAPLDRGRGASYLDDDHRRAARNARRRQPTAERLCDCGCRTRLPPGRKDRRFISDSHRKAASRAVTREQRRT